MFIFIPLRGLSRFETCAGGDYIPLTSCSRFETSATGDYIPLRDCSRFETCAAGDYIPHHGCSRFETCATVDYIPLHGCSRFETSAAGDCMPLRGCSIFETHADGDYIPLNECSRFKTSASCDYIPLRGCSKFKTCASGDYILLSVCGRFIALSSHSCNQTHLKMNQRSRNVSESSEISDRDYNSCDSSPSSRDCSPLRLWNTSPGNQCYLTDKIGSVGGFSFLCSRGGSINRDVFVFPIKTLKPKERELYVRTFISKLYNISAQNTSEVDKILGKLGHVKQCNLPHVSETSQAKYLVQNIQNLSVPVGFKMPDKSVASSTPGPRVSNVKDISTPHTATDSLRIINHLLLSDDDARYVRSISLVGLSSEYSVKQKRSELMGNGGSGWVVAEKKTLKKWFRKPVAEANNSINGQAAQKIVVFGRISKSDIVLAVQHWAQMVTDHEQYIDLQTLDNCPDILRDCVVVILGNDSGQGYCREGLRFVNRKMANSGSKVFVTAVMQGTDKSLSLFQKQAIFSSLSALRNLETIRMGGRERRLIKLSCMDYEAAHEEVGTQVQNEL